MITRTYSIRRRSHIPPAAISYATIRVKTQYATVRRRALVNGEVGVIVAPRGRLLMVLRFTIANGKIIEIEAVADPARVCQLDLAILKD